MTKGKSKRFLSYLLAICLLLSQNLVVYADGNEGQESKETGMTEESAVLMSKDAGASADETAVTSEGEVSPEAFKEEETSLITDSASVTEQEDSQKETTSVLTSSLMTEEAYSPETEKKEEVNATQGEIQAVSKTSESFENPLSSQSDPEEAKSKDSSVSETSDKPYFKITGYKDSGVILSLCYEAAMKPSLKKVLAAMPSVLKVQLDNSKTCTEIPVSWYCVGEDYETSPGHLFQFSPVFEEGYDAGTELDIISQAPYVNVLLDDNSSLTGSSSLFGIGTLATNTVSTNSLTDNRDTIFTYLVDVMGLNNAAASGVVANIYYESSYNPNASGDSGTSYGICQWHNGRYTNLKNYCSSHGYDYRTLEGQLNYLNYELNTSSYISILNYLRSVENTADGAYKAGYHWCYYFEIPANRATSSVTRGNYAKNTIWPIYKNYTSSAEEPVTDENPEESSSEETTPAPTIAETTAPQVPEIPDVSAPSSVQAAAASDGIIVSWSKAENATGYNVYRSDSENGTYSLIAEISGGSVTCYCDKGAAAGKIWYYYVTAVVTGEIYDICKTTANLNYRTEPSTSGTVVGTIPSGTQVLVVRGYEVDNDGLTWVKVFYKNNCYYCAAKYLSLVSEGEAAKKKESGKSSTVSIQVLDAVKSVTAKNITSGIQLNWTGVTGAKCYIVSLKNADGSTTQLANISASAALSYKDTELSAKTTGTTYTYQITAVSDSTCSKPTSVNVCFVLTPDMKSAANTTNGVKVSYGKSAGADGYYIYRKVTGGSYAKIAEVKGDGTTSYTDTCAVSGTRYTYTVRAYSGSVLSSYKTGVSVDYLASPVVSLAANSEGVKLTWNQIDCANAYIIYRKQTGESSYKVLRTVCSGSVLSYLDKTVTPGASATYRVRAITMSSNPTFVTTENLYYRTGPAKTYTAKGLIPKGTSVVGIAGSEIVGDGTGWMQVEYDNSTYYCNIPWLKMTDSATTSASGACSAVKTIIYMTCPALTGVSATASGITVKWNSVTGAKGYYVYRKTGSGSWTKIATVTSLSYTDKTGASGTTYQYTVRAYNGSDKSYYNSIKKILYLSTPSLTGAAKVTGGIRLTWGKVTGAAGYIVYRKVSGGSWSKIATISSGSTVTYTDKSGTKGKTYIYTVRATNGDYQSYYKTEGISCVMP